MLTTLYNDSLAVQISEIKGTLEQLFTEPEQKVLPFVGLV